MLKHVVIWKIKDPTQKARHAATVKAQLESMRGRIPGLLAIESGVDIGYDAGAHDVGLYCEFTDRAALDAYQQHPLHVEVKKVIGPLLTARHALDWDA
ncbi:MAG: Dabb family protein [Betaproteobacteria bacterium]|nr:Dabb family protein [Betaproteobacteria bacterium]